MKSLLICHIDHDGLAGGLLAEHFSLPFDKVVYWDYGQELLPENALIFDGTDDIVMQDFSISKELYDSLISKGKKVRIFDHHINETTEWVKTAPDCVLDDTRCGTKIFFEEYICKIIPRIRSVVKHYVELVDTYDRWQVNSPLWDEAMNAQRVLFKYAMWDCPDKRMSFDRFFTSVFRKLESQVEWKWTDTELRYIKESVTRENEVYRTGMKEIQYRTDSKGKKFGVFRAGGKISIVVDRMLRIEKMPVDYLIVLNYFKDFNGKVSGRCHKPTFDVRLIGLLNGHEEAAGGTFSVEEARTFWEHEDWCLKYKDEMVEGDEDYIWRGNSAKTR